ncbi:hypothetical protein LTR60_007623, partial [Cryomyces antarcticus]
LAFIREKAVLDASRMDPQPNPLASHPSHLSQPSRWVKEHSRKISHSLRNGYTAVSPIDSTSFTPKGSDVMLMNHSSKKGFAESVDSITLSGSGSDLPEAEKEVDANRHTSF